MAQDIILSTQGLTKEFKGFTAVSDINLEVRRGTIHALIGPNEASKKTTCFNLLSKFLDVTRGAIEYNGSHITPMRPADIARSGSSTPSRSRLYSHTCTVPTCPFCRDNANLVELLSDNPEDGS